MDFPEFLKRNEGDMIQGESLRQLIESIFGFCGHLSMQVVEEWTRLPYEILFDGDNGQDALTLQAQFSEGNVLSGLKIVVQKGEKIQTTTFVRKPSGKYYRDQKIEG